MTVPVKKHEIASRYVWKQINNLKESKNDSLVRATLARLRRGVGGIPGSDPDIWGETLGELNEDLLSKTDEPTKGEWAVYTALTLFAMHQQGADIKTNCMHKEDRPDDKVKLNSLGNAIRRLAGSKDSDSFNAIRRRFNAIVTSESIEEFSHHLRGMIQLLKAKGIELDYVALTKELYLFQNADNRDGLRLRWGQDFYRSSSAENAE